MKTKIEHWALKRIGQLSDEISKILLSKHLDMGRIADRNSPAHDVLTKIEEIGELSEALNES